MKRISLFILLIFGVVFTTTAQNSNIPTNNMNGPKDHAWEVGLHAGHFFTAGNVDFTPGYAAGIHVRRSLDYVFSLRLDLNYGSAKGEDEGNVRSFSNTWMSGSIQAIATLNNLKWAIGERKNNLYVLAGIGVNSFEADLELMGQASPDDMVSSDAAAHGEIGAGIGFKINNRINIGLEHKAMMVFGNRGDLLDAVPTFTPNVDGRGTFRDVVNYTSIRLNFNLGKPDEKTEPLYWLNPLDGVIADIQKLKDTRVTLNDEDGDGVIDMMDDEENTVEGANVNSRGVAMDSDGDGIKDHEDKEPYSSSQYPTNSEGVAQVPDIMAEVEKLVDARLKDFQPKTTTPAPTTNLGAWYLPTIYFSQDSDKLQNSAIGTLANVAQVIKGNPNLKFVVTGHTDQSGSDDYNNVLSYRRAKAVIDHLTEKQGVNRSALILSWKGETNKLVEGRDQINRRVEFRVATNETEMAPPAGASGN